MNIIYMENIPLLIRNIEFTKINISQIKTENDDRKNIFLKYNTNNFIIQLPELLYENNIKELDDYYELILNLECKNSEKTTQVTEFFNNLDNFFVNFMKHNKNKFFNTNKINYKSIVRNLDNKNYIKIKILKSNIAKGLIKLTKDNSNIKITEFNNKCYIKLLLDINAIWINKNHFGIYIKPIVLKKTEIIKQPINFVLDTDLNEANTILYSNIDTDLNSICNKNKGTDNKVLVSNINSDKTNTNIEENSQNNESTVTISSYKEKKVVTDDMSTVNFSTLQDIPEYNNDGKNSGESATSS